MTIEKGQLRELINDVLTDIGLWTPASQELLMLTAAQESHLGKYIRQIRGPAMGIFQMEPRTEADIWNNYLKYKWEIGSKIKEYKTVKHTDLKWNLAYQICMCRVHYLRVPKTLPSENDINGLASYWKQYYNTYLGKGTVAEAVNNYYKFCK